MIIKELETSDYWVYQDNCLVFKPKFNKIPSYKILTSYSKIIFSNYNEPTIAINENNIYKDEYKNLIKKYMK
jgi:hypothetical protein